MKKEKILSSVKDRGLVKKRREQMIKAAIKLFKEKGFHRTTTREIAKEAGFSIGTLYEYIRKKEDILFLVCDGIYEQVHHRLEASIDLEQPSIQKLITVTKSYIYLMDEMQEEVLLLYQELKSLSSSSQKYVLQKELDMTNMLKRVIFSSTPHKMSEQEIDLMTNNIFIKGQMWVFRRWILHKQFTLDEYIDLQINYLLKVIAVESESYTVE